MVKKIRASVDKDFTEPWLLEQVKEDIAQYVEAFTPSDIFRAFQDAMEEAGLDDELGVEGWGDYITECTAKAFPGGTDFNNKTHYCVEMTAEGFKDGHEEITKYRFYTNENGEVRLTAWNRFTGRQDRLYTIKRFICEG